VENGYLSCGGSSRRRRLLPHLAHLSHARFIGGLGAVYGVLALVFVIGGDLRTRASRRALERISYAAPSGIVLPIVTCYISALVILTVVAFMPGPDLDAGPRRSPAEIPFVRGGDMVPTGVGRSTIFVRKRSSSEGKSGSFWPRRALQ
jgi:hypothetical protein